jgi:hypothetical protein
MRELRLVGLTKDGRELLLVDEAGEEFRTPADDKLRAALRGDRARLGQLEIELDSALRPRDIQARIRFGATPDEVAAEAQVPVEKVLAYSLPVLAERQHIAQLARRSHVRRRNAEGPARQLHDVVAERLRARDIDPDSVAWDAWRREDGRWSVQASYQSGENPHTGVFVYDAAGRYCVADDDEARWLTGERQPSRKGPQPRPSGRGGERRLAAVPDGGDLLQLTEEDEATDDLTAVVRAISGPEAGRPTVGSDGESQVRLDADGYPRPDVGPADAALDVPSSHAEGAEGTPPANGAGVAGTTGETADQATAGTAAGTAPGSVAEAPSSPADPAAAPEPDAVAEPAGQEPPVEETPHRRRRAGKRARVPSWDEIMLGGGSGGASDDDTP